MESNPSTDAKKKRLHNADDRNQYKSHQKEYGFRSRSNNSALNRRKRAEEGTESTAELIPRMD